MPFLKTCLLIHPLENAPHLQVRSRAGQKIEAATLLDAIHEAERLLEVEIVPHHKPVRCYRMTGIPERKGMLVGVVVYRGLERLHPVYDSAFPLLNQTSWGISGLCD